MPLFYTVVMKKLNDELVLHRDTERIGVQLNAVHGPGLLVHAQLKIGQDRKAEHDRKGVEAPHRKGTSPGTFIPFNRSLWTWTKESRSPGTDIFIGQ